MVKFQLKDGESRKLEESPPSSADSNLSVQWKKERQADADEQWFNDDENEVNILIFGHLLCVL